MDLTRLLEMLFRRVLWRVVNRGIGAGPDRVAGNGGKPRNDMTPEERAGARKAQDMQRRARQAMRLTRRF